MCVILFLTLALLIGEPALDTLKAQTGGSDEGSGFSKYPILAKCSGKEDDLLNEILGINPDTLPGGENYNAKEGDEDFDIVDIWSERYHSTASSLIDSGFSGEYSYPDCLGELGDRLQLPGQQNPSNTPIRKMAEKLPPWQDEEDLEMLKYYNVPVVLLELLRVYECALIERFLIFGETLKETQDIYSELSETLWIYNYSQKLGAQWRKIGNELTVSRPTMNRALYLLSKTGNTQPLEDEIFCIYQASMDIRTAFTLGGEAAACMPRIQDAKDPLRDISK